MIISLKTGFLRCYTKPQLFFVTIGHGITLTMTLRSFAAWYHEADLQKFKKTVAGKYIFILNILTDYSEWKHYAFLMFRFNGSPKLIRDF